MTKPVYSGMLVLAGVRQTEQGDQVCFWLDGDYDEHPFTQYRTDASDSSYGAMFGSAIVEVGDDGEVVDTDARERLKAAQGVEQPKVKDRDVTTCAICCKDPLFHRFLKSFIKHGIRKERRADMAYSLPSNLFQAGYASLTGPYAEDFARHFVYWWCNIQSRSELAWKRRAAESWRGLEQKFYRWRSERERHERN